MRQDAVVREAVAGCHEEGLPLILEPIVYTLPEETREAFAAAFPSLVVAAAKRLQPLEPDVLKVQFPRDDSGDEAEDFQAVVPFSSSPSSSPSIVTSASNVPNFTRPVSLIFLPAT